MPENLIITLEGFARQHMTDGEIAHDFKHADRVRNHALRIAQQEGYPHPERVEAAALLHDIALKYGERREHGRVGAEMAVQFFRENHLFEADAIEEIAHAIHWHNSVKPDPSLLLNILRDADILDLLGAVGLMRGLTAMAHRPDYDPTAIQGETWGFSARDFDERFASGRGTGPTIIDHINFQISCYDNLYTAAARQIALPLVNLTRAFIEQLAREIEPSRAF